VVRETTSVEAPATLFEAATLLQRKLVENGYAFCFIGGLAFQRWGNPRYTQDVDATLACPLGAEQEIVEFLCTWFESRIQNPLEFAMRARIFLAKLPGGTPADIALGTLDFELRAVESACI
jgi:hypothetical protein